MKRFVVVLTVLALSVSGVALAAASGKQTSGVAYVTATHSEGKDLYVSGDFKDKLLGRGALVYITTVSSGNQPGTFNVKAKRITLFTTKGTMTGAGSGTETVHSDGTADVSNGKFKLVKGTGAYAGHTLTGTFSGPLRNGVYTFSYKATYK